MIVPMGYTEPNAEEWISSMMGDPQALLVDIRLVPFSRWRPPWNKRALAERWGNRYIHIPDLGNLNYQHREDGIVLKNPEKGLATLSSLEQQGHTLILLCACKNYGTCHRKVVYEAFAIVAGNSPSGIANVSDS